MLDPDSTALLNPGASPLIDREARTGLAAVLASERPPAAAHAILSLLERLQVGRLLVTTPAGASLSFGHGEPHASIRLANWKVFGASIASSICSTATAKPGRAATSMRTTTWAIPSMQSGSIPR
jgi:hypothetical protein